jgi:tRNA pseudouridine38-40 synthase
MQNYRLIVSYDGSSYCGWQAQKKQKSIEQTLKSSFQHAFKQPVFLWGASRTDAGVHALGQVVSVQTPLNVHSEDIKRAWNNVLPNDIVICNADHMQSLFNPYRNVDKKTYHYHIFTSRPTPFMERYGWFVPRTINIEKLKACLQIFVGKHDFRSFVMAQDKRTSSIRTIFSITLEQRGDFEGYTIAIVGNAFLRHMVRRIVGASLGVALDKGRKCIELEEALAQKDPRQHYLTAPAKGLMLYKIDYQKV